MKPAQQEWVCELPIMQQSVLFAAVRAPDGIRKNHPVKVLLRWYRRCVLLSAFEGEPLPDPFVPGGGSFTGPFEPHHAEAAGLITSSMSAFSNWSEDRWNCLDRMRGVYLDHVDELPHHFQLHFMHAAQIVGFHHPWSRHGRWWSDFYLMIVDDAHLHPELPEEMNLRLCDNPEEWRKREVVVAK
ncbi:hypothetical protein [Pararhizobium sp.]|uniref:hypothetical protein n=1 Tax=Pararhizobium sp. TaxID=1977563 RepID=UPI003D0F8255